MQPTRAHGAPPAGRTERGSFPFREFVHAEAAGGVLLVACALLALAWANSPWAAAYADLWDTTLTVGPGDLALSKSLCTGSTMG